MSQGDITGVGRDVVQSTAFPVRNYIYNTGQRIYNTPDPPRRQLPRKPGEGPYEYQRRQVKYNRAHPGSTNKLSGAVLKGASKLVLPIYLYSIYKDFEQLWNTAKNYPKKDKSGVYRYNKNE